MNQILSPPAFTEAKNRWQKVRSAGMNPNYWYAVEYDRTIAKGQLKEEELPKVTAIAC